MPGQLREQGGLPKVLIVDDDEAARLAIASLLGPDEHRIESAASVEEARQRMTAVRPDIVLCDLVMRGASGDQFCRWLKRHPLWRFVPVIAVTRIDHLAAVTGLLDAGADDVVIKPVRRFELRARVGAALRTRHRYLELASPEDA